MDAGDVLFQTEAPPTAVARRRADLLKRLYRQMGYDAVGVGFRDLAAGLRFLGEGEEGTRLPWISMNLRQNGKIAFKPYVITQISGVPVAILALTSTRVHSLYPGRGLDALDPVPLAQALVPELRRKARLVIVLSNLGEMDDRRLAATVQGIDLIVGSGFGGRLATPERMNGTYVVRPDAKGKSIGRAVLELGPEGGLARLENRLIVLDERAPADGEVERAVDAIGNGPLSWSPPAPRRVAPSNAGLSPGENPFLKAVEESKHQDQTQYRKRTVPGEAQAPAFAPAEPGATQGFCGAGEACREKD